MRPYILYSALLLTGCSTTETFDCKAGKGVGCKSITEVNSLVDRGGFGEEGATTPPSVQPVTTFAGDMSLVHRIQEQHLRVWIAPFQDEHGNLHEGSTVHTVVKPGYWTAQEGA